MDEEEYKKAFIDGFMNFVTNVDMEDMPVSIELKMTQALLLLNRNLEQISKILEYDAIHRNIVENDFVELYQQARSLNETLKKFIDKYSVKEEE